MNFLEQEKQFHFRDGTSISSLDALKEKIETISYNEFYHHVNSTRNDFANWVRYVLKDDSLADALDKTTSIVETVEVMNDYLHPRAHKSHDDMQSKIEESLGIDLEEPQRDETNQGFDEVPQMSHESTNQEDNYIPEMYQETTIQADESPQLNELEELPVVPQETSNQEQTPTQKLAQEQVQEIKQDVASETKSEMSPSQESEFSHHYKRSGDEKKELKEFHHNLDKIIVKDFIWGMFFGLVLGFIIARMLSL